MINYKYIQTLQFPLKSFLSTIIKVKNYKNYLPWCLDSFEKSHKSYELSLEEIQLKHPEILCNKFIKEYLITQNSLNQENQSDSNGKKSEKKFPIKTFDGYIKVGFDIIEFSYLSKVYLICEKIVLSRTDDTQSNIFKKLESTWILSENDSSSNDELVSSENLNLLKYKKIINNNKLINSNEKKFTFIEGHKEISESVHVEYFIEFEMRSFVFRNLTSLCINFLGENIVKSFINETQKIIQEEKHLKSINSDKNNESLINLISPNLNSKTNNKIKHLFFSETSELKNVDTNLNNTTLIANQNNGRKYFNNINFENDIEITNNLKELNFYNLEESIGNLNQKQIQEKETMGFTTQTYNNNLNMNNNIINDNFNFNQEENFNFIHLLNNSIGLSKNPFISVVQDLEERIKILEKINKEKQEEMESLKLQADSDREYLLLDKQKLEKDLAILNEKYLVAITSNKICADELKIITEQNFNNLRREKDNKLHDEEKKIILLERLNEKHLQDIEKLININSQAEITKQDQIETLKNSLKLVILEYEAIYKTYEENLLSNLKQIDSLKQLYITRENEFLNITNYYTKTINQYATPIYELDMQSKNKNWEELYFEQLKEIDELRKNLENSIRENNELQTELMDSKPKLRQRINDAMSNYEFKLTEITEMHDSLLKKLNKLFSYMEFFENKFTFFNALIEDNKKLIEELTLAECKLKDASNEDLKQELLYAKEENIKLMNELEIKDNLLKQYLDFYESMKLSDSNNKEKQNNSNFKNTDKIRSCKMIHKNLSEDILIKLNFEIGLLSYQIISINKSKSSLENFYQDEIFKLSNNLKEKNEKIEELSRIIRKIEHDSIVKKDSVYNLWVLEFKEFKDNLLNLADIKKIIEKFEAEGDELNEHKKQILNEEIHLARQELRNNNEIISIQKKYFENELRESKLLLESYKFNFTSKLENLEKLIKSRQAELNALASEKENLIKVEENIKKIAETEKIAWNEQKEQIKSLLNHQKDTKNREISILRNQIQILQKEIDENRNNKDKNLANILNSVESQIAIFRDRELFNLKQMQNSEENFKAFKIEKEMIISLLREEIKNLKKNNHDLSKAT